MVAPNDAGAAGKVMFFDAPVAMSYRWMSLSNEVVDFCSASHRSSPLMVSTFMPLSFLYSVVRAYVAASKRYRSKKRASRSLVRT